GGLMLCGSSCVDDTCDTNNCGGCDIVCAAGESCVGGACVDLDGGATSASSSSSTSGAGGAGGAGGFGGGGGKGGVGGMGGAPNASSSSASSSSASGGGFGGADAGADACVPQKCGIIANAFCGFMADGCGGTIYCPCGFPVK